MDKPSCTTGTPCIHMAYLTGRGWQAENVTAQLAQAQRVNLQVPTPLPPDNSHHTLYYQVPAPHICGLCFSEGGRGGGCLLRCAPRRRAPLPR